MSDTRDELVEKLRQLVDANRDSPDREVQCAAGVLATLSGALLELTTEKLFNHVIPFAEGAVRRLSSSRN